ncbi:d6c6f057-125f-4a8c-a7a4-615a0ab9c336 [Sclerotinia trifoliorum]|uniref:D6c6f057-125f-4a8c-a7a4-615a0ab9c336 n=1 Tax=Sclerotinia trifoliorum TaxID=28548 RepID=A0A8H2VRT0_9HELO|nr:d6c6f057-125f-4a8c-a7a4-615a0ab9c336 [Sclerotinia trifoliorum]
MAPPIPGQNYPFWNSPILNQEYPRWNNLFDTINLNDQESLQRILQAANTAEKFHPFNLKLPANTTLNNAEIIALRDLSYAFNRNFLCRDIVRHLISLSRYDDGEFTLGREMKFYIEILKNCKLSPVRKPLVYLRVRREFCFCASDLGFFDEDEAKRELDRWESWGFDGGWEDMDVEGVHVTCDRNYRLGNGRNGDGSEVARAKDEEGAEIFEAAKILMSMRAQRN